MSADSFESFVAYRKKASALTVLLSLNGTFIGGGMFFATGQMGFEAGFVPMILPVCTAIGLAGVAVLIARIRRVCDEAGALTLYDYIDHRISGSQAGKALFTGTFVTTNLFLYFFLLAGQFLILSTFIESYGGVAGHWALIGSIAIVFVNTLIYGIVGGLKKDMWTDAFQMLVILFAMAVIVWRLAASDVVDQIRHAPAPTAGDSYGWLFVVGALVFFSPAFLVRFDIWQRGLAAKTSRGAIVAIALSVPVVAIAYFVFISCGIYTRSILGPDEALEARFAVTYAMDHLLDSGWLVVVALALFAAVMSSADTLLNIASISLHRLIVGKTTDKTARRDLIQIRLITVAVCLAAAVLVVLAADVVDLMVGAFSSLAIMMPALLYVVFARRPSASVGASSVILGLAVFLVVFFAVPEMRKTAFTVGTSVAGLALAVAWGVSALRARRR